MSATRSRVRTLVAGAVAFLALGAPEAHAATLFSEDFESVGGTMTVYGAASRDCTTSYTLLCSLKIPDSTGGSRSGAHDTASRTMSGATTLSGYFKASCTSGNFDSDVTVTFNTGGVTLHVTEGAGTNTGVSLISSTQHRNFTSWKTANTWYSWSITIDPGTDTATATFNGVSTSVAIPSSATTITKVDLNGINWGSTVGCSVHYDTVLLVG